MEAVTMVPLPISMRTWAVVAPLTISVIVPFKRLRALIFI
jgi:hypothetical protein